MGALYCKVSDTFRFMLNFSVCLFQRPTSKFTSWRMGSVLPRRRPSQWGSLWIHSTTRSWSSRRAHRGKWCRWDTMSPGLEFISKLGVIDISRQVADMQTSNCLFVALNRMVQEVQRDRGRCSLTFTLTMWPERPGHGVSILFLFIFELLAAFRTQNVTKERGIFHKGFTASSFLYSLSIAFFFFQFFYFLSFLLQYTHFSLFIFNHLTIFIHTLICCFSTNVYQCLPVLSSLHIFIATHHHL